MNIRQAHASDLPYLYEICLKTGWSGRDATHLLADPWLLGQVFAAPYVIHNPEFCLVVADQGRPQGYVVGCPDSAAYQAWYESRWLPELRSLYAGHPAPANDFETWILGEVFSPGPPFEAPASHPAHLHIDLLPACQGQGWGRKLIDAFCGRLRGHGVPGFHLGVGRSNQAAIAFYTRLGLSPLCETPGCLYLGKSLD
jgi:ribosomal protein S18 acetylase RimI-like enzyme